MSVFNKFSQSCGFFLCKFFYHFLSKKRPKVAKSWGEEKREGKSEQCFLGIAAQGAHLRFIIFYEWMRNKVGAGGINP